MFYAQYVLTNSVVVEISGVQEFCWIFVCFETAHGVWGQISFIRTGSIFPLKSSNQRKLVYLLPIERAIQGISVCRKVKTLSLDTATQSKGSRSCG